MIAFFLNISGGGTQRLKNDFETRTIEPWLRVRKSTGVDAILEKIGLRMSVVEKSAGSKKVRRHGVLRREHG